MGDGRAEYLARGAPVAGDAVNGLPTWAPNVHPLLVHFPIGWWVAAVIADFVVLAFPKAAWADSAATFLYPAGAVAAAFTYLTGRQAGATVLVPGMAYPIVQAHWNWALATTISFAAIATLRVWFRLRGPLPRGLLRTALFVAALAALGSLVQTGERGARLVFERGVGVASPPGSR